MRGRRTWAGWGAMLGGGLVLLAALAGGAGVPSRAGAPPGLPGAGAGPYELTYCAPGGVPLAMDLYPAATADVAPRPVALFVHGGSWSGGDKRAGEGKPEIAALTAAGYLVGAINYRLAPQWVFPAPIEDVKCAVRFLRAHAADLRLDPQRIGAWGASAGGQLVSLLGLAGPAAGLEGDGGYPEQSSRVQAVVDMYGRADLGSVPSTRPDLLPIFGGVANLGRYSPVSYITPDGPPFLILHGDEDTTVPPALSEEFAARLQTAGVPVTLVMVQHAGHGFSPTAPGMHPSREALTRLVVDFFNRTLAAPAPSGPPAALPPGGATIRYPETGQSVRGLFLHYWQTHGGLAQQGYPISRELPVRDPTDGRTYTMQFFERAVLEYHPENAPPFDVLPVLLGAQRYAARYPGGAPGQHPSRAGDALLFAATGHRAGGLFLHYWQTHGGLLQQGYPISEEFTEVSPLDGRPYTVQYFERAVFEDHPANDPATRILLSQLGTFAFRAGPAQATEARPLLAGAPPAWR